MFTQLSQKDELIEIIVNQYKSAYGFKPRGSAYTRLTEMSYTELQKEAEYLDGEVERSIQEEKSREALAVAAFEAKIADAMGLGAADEATAYRWLLQAEDLVGEPDEGYIEYNLGLPYGYLKGKFA
jgi:hypothetical protein